MSDKPKCPVFGCAIPRGIPHEHPAGVSAVMRDPVEPLNSDERSELERYRAAAETNLNADDGRLREGILRQSRSMQNCAAGSPLYDRVMGAKAYVVHADAPMVPGRKLRDTLLLAGMMVDVPRPEIDSGIQAATAECDRLRNLHDWHVVKMANVEPPRMLTLIPTIGHIAARIVLGVAAVGIVAAYLYMNFPEIQRWFQ